MTTGVTQCPVLPAMAPGPPAPPRRAAWSAPRALAGAALALRAVAKSAVFLLKVFPMLPSRPVDWETPSPVVERVTYPTKYGLAEGDELQETEEQIPPAPEREPFQPEADPEPAAAGDEGGGGGGGSEGARLIALNMALNGTPRAETAAYLSDNFDLPDQDALLDEVFAAHHEERDQDSDEGDGRGAVERRVEPVGERDGQRRAGRQRVVRRRARDR